MSARVAQQNVDFHRVTEARGRRGYVFQDWPMWQAYSSCSHVNAELHLPQANRIDAEKMERRYVLFALFMQSKVLACLAIEADQVLSFGAIKVVISDVAQYQPSLEVVFFKRQSRAICECWKIRRSFTLINSRNGNSLASNYSRWPL